MNHRISRLCGGFPVFLPGHVAQHGIHILLKDTRCIQSEDHCGPTLQSSAMTEAAAATAAQLAAVVLAVTFALSVADRLLKRWKVGPRRSRIASSHRLHTDMSSGAGWRQPPLWGLLFCCQPQKPPIMTCRRCPTRGGSSLSCSRRSRTCSARRRRSTTPTRLRR